MKKIFINGRFLTKQVTGVQRYAIELLAELDAILEEQYPKKSSLYIVILSPQKTHKQAVFKNIKIMHVGHLHGHFWEQFELPWYARRGLLVSLCNTGPILHPNQIITIHDAAVYGFPTAYSLTFRLWYRSLHFLLGKFSKQIVTVSNFSKKELIRYFGIDSSKIKVILESGNHILKLTSDPKIIHNSSLFKKPYLLAVSSINPNKNFTSIIQAMAYLNDLNIDLVIAGGTSNIYSEAINFSSENVKYLGYVTDEELKALYENAMCFIYPSFYEGFGLPPLEAMTCGCPVIVSAIPPLQEVCGDAALYCDPSNPESIAQQIKQLMSSNVLRDKLKQSCITRASQFSWRDCAETFLDLILQYT